MKAETLGIVATILGVLTLLGIGWVLLAMPATPVIPKCPEIPECKPVVTTEEVEVIKEIETETDYKQKVVDALLGEVSKDKELRKCGGRKFDAEEISVKRIYDGFTLEESSDGDLEISGVKIKLSYDNGDCYKTLTCGLNAENELVC